MITHTSLPTQVLAIPVVTPDTDRSRIDRHLERVLSRFRGQFHQRPEFQACAEHISEFVLNGGKRVRPKLCLAMYRILSESPADAPVPRPLMWIASSLELFHAFMLVHDDLIDRSPLRRNRDSLHQSIRLRSSEFLSTPMSEHKAASMALVIGDIMFTLGMSMVTQAGLEGRTARNVQKIVTDMLLETGLGQGLDILFEDRPLEDFDLHTGDDEILSVYLYKTARYTITGPMLIGAAMALAKPDLMASLTKLGDLLGLAYQIRNDLEDLDNAANGQECSDIDTGKRTPILIHAFQKLSPLGKRTLQGLLDQSAGPEKRRQILSIMHSTGSIERAQKSVEKLQFEALATVQNLPIAPEKKQAIARLASMFTHA